MDMWDGFIGAALGGIFAGSCSLIAIKAQLDTDRNRRQQESDEKINAILSALYHEVKASWEYYMREGGLQLEKHDMKRLFHVTVSEVCNNHVIYEQNAQHVGLIKDFRLREAIVNTYVSLNGLGSSFVTHNMYVEKSIEAKKQNELLATNATDESLKKTRAHLSSATQGMKIIHDKTKADVVDLLSRLRAIIDESEKS